MEITDTKFSKVREDQPDPPGRSLLPAFESDVRIERDYLWWSHENHNAIRIGDFKLVKTAETDWELFDLSRDRAETNDLAKAMPEKVHQLQSYWAKITDEFVELVRRDFPASKKKPK